MSDTTTLAPKADQDLIDLVAAKPEAVLTGEVALGLYVDALVAETKDLSQDVSTKVGRDRIKSAAQTLRSRKAAIDKRRKELTADWRQKTAEVNEAGNLVKEKLDSLIAEVRAPVTAWEEAEERRMAEADALLERLKTAAHVAHGSTSTDVQARLDEVRGLNLNDELLGPRLEMAEELKAQAVDTLTRAVSDLKAQEEQQRELERLRREKEAREEQERQERAARQAKEREEARAKAEAERIEQAKKEAVERARREAEEKAEQERLERERAAQAEIHAANERAAAAERAAQEERDRIEREARAERERKAAEAEAQRQREADIAHREEVIHTAAKSLTGLSGMSQKLATAVINEIAAGNVPAVEVRF